MGLLRTGPRRPPTRCVPGHPYRLRFGPWRGDTRTAYVAPSAATMGPISASDVLCCVERARLAGYDSVVTAALGARDQQPFDEAGFTVAQRLHLLVHPLDRLPPLDAPVTLRRARRRDRAAALAIDHRAFDGFWRLDEPGLRDAVAATAEVRFRVAQRSGGLVGYVVTGKSAARGYVQRLAVSPAVEGQGVGAALLTDGLQWLRRRGARDAVVNTQEGNERSLRLYQRSGFVVQPEGLAVLGFDLTGLGQGPPATGGGREVTR